MLKIPGFAIEKRLGQGNSGTVFQARQLDPQRRVALRILNPELPLAVRRAMLADAQSLRVCEHPHLQAIHQAGEIHTQQYVAMELLPGFSLRQLLQRRLSIPRALEVIRGVAEALAYLHQQGLVHRDIRPRNILFRANGSPVLSDVSSQPLPVGGIHRYLSPEQRAATHLTPASDLYALGLVLLDMLDLEQATPLTIPPPLRPLEPLLEGLLAPDSTGRYPCAEAFIDDLDQCLRAQPHWQSRRLGGRFFRDWTEDFSSWCLPAMGIAGGLLGAGVLSVQLLSTQYPHWHWDITRSPLQQPTAIPSGPSSSPTSPILVQAPSTPPPPGSPLTGRPGEAPREWRVRLRGQSQQGQQLALGILPGQWQPRLAVGSLRQAPGQGVSLRNDREPLLARLLETAEAQLQNQRLTTPAGDNAVETYQAILELNPGDPRALAGLQRVTSRYLRWAERAWQQGSYEDSLARIERGLVVDPVHPGLLGLKAQLQRQRRQEVPTEPRRVRVPGGPFKPAEPQQTVVEAPPPDLWNRSSR